MGIQINKLTLKQQLDPRAEVVQHLRVVQSEMRRLLRKQLIQNLHSLYNTMQQTNAEKLQSAVQQIQAQISAFYEQIDRSCFTEIDQVFNFCVYLQLISHYVNILRQWVGHVDLKISMMLDRRRLGDDAEFEVPRPEREYLEKIAGRMTNLIGKYNYHPEDIEICEQLSDGDN